MKKSKTLKYLKVETSTVWGTLKFSMTDAHEACGKISYIRAFGVEIKRWEAPKKPMAVSIPPASIGEISYFGSDSDLVADNCGLIELL